MSVQVEKQRNEAQRELDELGERLDEAGGATQAQVSFHFLFFFAHRPSCSHRLGLGLYTTGRAFKFCLY